MAFYYKLEGPAKTAYDRMVDELYKLAETELKKSRAELILRSLRPKDIDSSLNPEWTFNISSGGAWNTMVDNKTILDNRFVGINGIFYPKSTGDQAVSQIKITKAGEVVRYWQIQGINYTENLAIYFDDPFIVKQNTPITIQGWGVTTGATEKIVFRGMVVEKAGLLVAKD